MKMQIRKILAVITAAACMITFLSGSETAFADSQDARALYAESRGAYTDTFSFPNNSFTVSNEAKDQIEPFLNDLKSDLPYTERTMLSNGYLLSVLQNGLCYGYSALTVLTHNGVIKPEEIQAGAATLSDIVLTDEVEFLLGSYAAMQCYWKVNSHLLYRTANDSPEQHITELLETAARCDKNGTYFLILLTGPNLSHAVTGIGMMRGNWTWNEKQYDVCIPMNDSNVIHEDHTSAHFSEKFCIYVNSTTKEFYVSGYDFGNDEGDIGFVTDDTDLLSFHAPLHPCDEPKALHEDNIVRLAFRTKDMPDEENIQIEEAGKKRTLAESSCAPVQDGLYTEFFTTGDTFQINHAENTSFSVKGTGYFLMVETQDQSEEEWLRFEADPEQITIHNQGTEQHFIQAALIYDENEIQYSEILLDTRYEFTVEPGETVSMQNRPDGILLGSDRGMNPVLGYVMIHEKLRLADDLAQINSDYVFEAVRFDADSTMVVFDNNTQKIRFQLDLDHDGVFEYMVQKGDVNGDGIAYDVSDAQITLQAYVKWLASGSSRHAPCIRANVYQADMNDDGFPDAADAQLILREYVDRLVQKHIA